MFQAHPDASADPAARETGAPRSGTDPLAEPVDGRDDAMGPPVTDPSPEPEATLDRGEPFEPSAPLEPKRPRRRSRARMVVIWLSVAVVAVIAGGALFLSGYSLGRQTATTPGTPVDEAQLFQPFWDAYRAVTQRYAGGPVDRQQLVEGAIRGMISSLGDRYSMYLSPDELRQSLEGVNARFEGIGAQIGTRDATGQAGACSTLATTCQLVVVQPLEGSPAIKAGLESGDVIASIDGASVDGLTIDAARQEIRGPAGSTVTLGIVRTGARLSVPIVRGVIVQQVVTGRDLADGRVGYIRITNFTTEAAPTFESILRADLAKGERKLVVDVRGDPGGYVDAARAIASQFIASGPIFYEQTSNGDRIETDATGSGLATDPSIRVVVLVDGGSASASEIFAGALQDRGRATLVGQTTFGKGTMQEWDQLQNGMGGFRLTIAKWLTPDGRWIHGKGLTPNVIVPPAQDGTDAPLATALRLLGEGSPAA
jgi:carboxyl-terminal processing protease